MKRILLLGSTGSIGTQTIDVVRKNSRCLSIVGLVAHSNEALLQAQVDEFHPAYVGIVRGALSRLGAATLLTGDDCAERMAEEAEYDVLVMAVVGASGLRPTIAALKRGKHVAIATKEVLVMAGSIVCSILQKSPHAKLFPIDSEHSAIWQSLRSGKRGEVEKLILTASGGPFRGKSKKDLQNVTVVQALGHPTYKMGKKISIDSATMMNKGLEVIEARWLFAIPAEKIEVVVHPQSILHSAVLFCDGSMVGQMGLPDMRIAIQYALSYPDRLPNTFPRLSLADIKMLTFEKPDVDTFLCLQLAYDAIKVGGTMPAVLNAANEVAVDLFLKEKIRFLDIPKVVQEAMEKHTVVKNPSLDEIIAADQWARKIALTL